MSCSGSTFNLSIYQGMPFSLGIIVNDDNGAPIDLSSYSVTGAIRLQYSSGDYLYFNSNLVNDPTGFLTIGLDSSGSQSIPIGQQLYGVNLYPSGADNFTNVLRGYANIYPTII